MVDAKRNAAGGRKRVRIGVVAPLSGRGAKLGRETMQEVEMAVEDGNAKCSSSGIRFELACRDDKGDEAQRARVATALIEGNDVMGIVGHHNSNVTLAVAWAYCDASMPLISPIVSNPKLTEQAGPSTSASWSARRVVETVTQISFPAC